MVIMVPNDSIAHLEKRSVKTLIKRCPFCNSSCVYKRVRCESNVKSYRCYKCKKEFDVPIIGEKRQMGIRR